MATIKEIARESGVSIATVSTSYMGSQGQVMRPEKG